MNKALEALERMRPYIGFEHTEDYIEVKQALTPPTPQEVEEVADLVYAILTTNGTHESIANRIYDEIKQIIGGKE